MKEKLAFFLIPIVTVISSIKYIDSLERVISNILFIAINCALCLCFYFGLKKMKIEKKNILPKVVILSALFFVADQLLKLIVYMYKLNFNVIGKFLSIKPTENRNQTAAFNLLRIELDIKYVIIFKAILFILLILVFARFLKKEKSYPCIFILLFSSAFATFIDTVAWGYTLDYIYFYKLVCYDLKDFYVDTATTWFFIEFIASEKEKMIKSKTTIISHDTKSNE